MQFRDLEKQYQILKDRLDDAVLDTMASAVYIGGSCVSDLENQLAAYVGMKHCITCANGTDALQLALMAWGVGPGDAVIVPDFTFFSSGEVVSAVGATPVFIDVDADTFNLDSSQIEPAYILARENGLDPRVVIPVDLFGLPADYSRIKSLGEEFDLLILEDGAQGFGGSIHGKMACSFGDVSTTSFFPAKPLGCYGDGGAVFTDNDEAAARIRSYAVHGKGTMKYDNVRIGMNSRLDAIQAALLSVKLEAFIDFELNAADNVAGLYAEHLLDFAFERGVTLPQIPSGYRSSWAQYTIKLPEEIDRSAVQSSLRNAGVPTMVYYPKPMHEQEAFNGRSLVVGDCPTTKLLCETVLSLPMGPYLTEVDIASVADALKRTF